MASQEARLFKKKHYTKDIYTNSMISYIIPWRSDASHTAQTFPEKSKNAFVCGNSSKQATHKATVMIQLKISRGVRSVRLESWPPGLQVDGILFFTIGVGVAVVTFDRLQKFPGLGRSLPFPLPLWKYL